MVSSTMEYQGHNRMKNEPVNKEDCIALLPAETEFARVSRLYTMLLETIYSESRVSGVASLLHYLMTACAI
jgi:hypothetical protein